MIDSLSRWIRDADAERHLIQFRISTDGDSRFERIRSRPDDYYIGLVSELFDLMGGRGHLPEQSDWARLGNAFAQLASNESQGLLRRIGVPLDEVVLYSATAFYCGGFPASAYLTIRTVDDGLLRSQEGGWAECFELLGRPSEPKSSLVKRLVRALREGDLSAMDALSAEVSRDLAAARLEGPRAWIKAKLIQRMLERFRGANLCAVLPVVRPGFWTPLIHSFVDRSPPAWEFFPSQIEAIERGLLEGRSTFSLQMPTGAGKTALCETILFHHAVSNPDDVALLLVPFRALAAELRGSLVRRLIEMGVPSRCAYGGTVPTGDEVASLADTRVMVATPEAISGLLNADTAFLQRISLVICDEGHLLDGPGRGVGLELLLARLRARSSGAPRFIFVSAIVPNIEEINSWLGGTPDTVVRSTFRPALAEYAVLRETAAPSSSPLSLEMNPHQSPPIKYEISQFLRRSDFQFENKKTNRTNTYPFGGMNVRAIAVARKALPLGGVVVFAANKRGNAGAVGLAGELLSQLEVGMPMPMPADFQIESEARPLVEYLGLEYGDGWIGAAALRAGAVLHHGDIPQETREILEDALRREVFKFSICTSTLAEGVNLPIRTLVLYSVSRKGPSGNAQPLLTRDIKNLVGRAGRAGSNTKGLVICVNEREWDLVAQVANQGEGEAVVGALRQLIDELIFHLAMEGGVLSDAILESSPRFHPLIDGVDSVLIDLAAEEVDEATLVGLASGLASQTFAAQRLPESSRTILDDVFRIRARRVAALARTDGLTWIKETGARARLLDGVLGLVSAFGSWETVSDPLDHRLLSVLVDWVWRQPEASFAIATAYRMDGGDGGGDIDSVKRDFVTQVSCWMAGNSFVEIARSVGRDIDDVLAIHANLVSFVFQTLVEQAVALLVKVFEAQMRELPEAVRAFPDHLRFGVPSRSALLLGRRLRHRRAAVLLGEVVDVSQGDQLEAFRVAREFLRLDELWGVRLGGLVLRNTIRDLDVALR